MPINRFQFSDDFVLKSGKVGINTSEPQEKLEVIGTIIADNITASSISNLHTYEGFLIADHDIDQDITLSSNITSSLSGEIIVGDEATVTIGEEATSSQGNIDSLKVYNTFTIPTGGTEDRPRKVKPGQLYYNKDFKTIEFFDGNVWRQVDNTTRSGRGVFGGGGDSTGYSSIIDYINISTTGNAQNFGNLSITTRHPSGCSSEVRGIVYLGYITPGLFTNTIEYITIASQGNSIDFGDINEESRYSSGSCSSSTRGVFAGGFSPSPVSITNTIQYIQISTIGNSLDFGDLTSKKDSIQGALSSPVRGLFGGGRGAAPTYTFSNVIDSITIASTGNAITFGNLSSQNTKLAGCSNGIRGVFAGGYITPTNANINTIEYVSISSNGNAVYFGDLTFNGSYRAGTSSRIRGVFGGGGNGTSNVIDYIQFSSSGNAQDFGDLTIGRYNPVGLSDSHGGLGGF